MAKIHLAEKPSDETDPSTSPAPTPAFEPPCDPTNPKAALRRCTKAWERAHKVCRDEEIVMKFDREILTSVITANQAYCEAMPLLVGEEGVRDFLACTAHGIATGIIKEKRGTQLIYAAQVAINLLQHQTRQQNLSQFAPSRRAQKQLPPPPSPTTAQKSMQEREQAVLNQYFAISS